MNKENEKKYQAFLKKLTSEEVYFKNSQEDAAIKSVPGKNGGYWVKLKGQPAFATSHLNEVVNGGILEYSEISKAEFERY